MATETERQQKMQELEPALQPLYFAPESGYTLATIFQAAGADAAHYDDYSTVIGDTILGFHKLDELQALLTREAGIPEDIAANMLPALMAFLAPMKGHEEGGMLNQEREAPNTIPAAPAAPIVEAPAEPVDQRIVQPMRTMGNDVTQVQGYQAYRSLFPEESGLDDTPIVQSSSQADLLERVPTNPAAAPAPTDDTAA